MSKQNEADDLRTWARAGEGSGPIGRETYGLPETVASYWRGIIERRILTMRRVADVTEREAIRGYWSQADIGQGGTPVTREAIDGALNLVGSDDTRAPLLVKVWSVINLCSVSEKVAGQELEAHIWQNLHEAVFSEPDGVAFMVLTGAWLAGMGLNNPEQFAKIATELDRKITDDNKAIYRFGIQVAAARLTEHIRRNELELGILSVLISGGSDQEHRSSHGITGYPDTMVILPEHHIPSLAKLKEGVVMGVPESGLLVYRALMAMVGVEERTGSAVSSRVRDYPERKWSFVSAGLLRAVEIGQSGILFVPDGASYWIAARVASDVYRPGKRVTVGELRSAVLKVTESLARDIDATDQKEGRAVRLPGVLRVGHRELQEKIGAREENTFELARKQTEESAVSLLTASAPVDGEYIVIPDRSQIRSVFLDVVWGFMPEADKLAFARVILHPHAYAWERFSPPEQEALVGFVERGERAVLAEHTKLKLFRLVFERLQLKWETIRDKEGIEAQLLYDEAPAPVTA